MTGQWILRDGEYRLHVNPVTIYFEAANEPNSFTYTILYGLYSEHGTLREHSVRQCKSTLIALVTEMLNGSLLRIREAAPHHRKEIKRWNDGTIREGQKPDFRGQGTAEV